MTPSWMILLLYLTGNLKTEANRDLWRPGATPVHHHSASPSIVQAPPPGPFEAAATVESPVRLYTFKGKVLLEGEPYPGATVRIRFRNPDESQARETRSGADGSYTLQILSPVREKEPIDWLLEVASDDGRRLEREGRQIILRDPQVNFEEGFDLTKASPAQL